MISNAHILIAALDWGFGHLTRTTALIHRLLKENNSVVIAASPSQANYWKETFPLLKIHLVLPDNHIRWEKWGQLRLMLRFPFFRANWKREESAIAELCKVNAFDLIISDNRYGVRNNDVKSVLLTHQLSLAVGGIKGIIVNWYLTKRANRFHEIWVPDKSIPPRLSGKLNESKGILRPVKYISSLHLPVAKTEQSNNAVLVLLSGPEPQRTDFAALCSKLLIELNQPFVLAGSCQLEIHSELAQTLGQISPKESMERQAQHRRIICRSGYSTLMELQGNNKKAVLIPTPGQSEQIYLAQHWNQAFAYPSCAQEKLNKKKLELLLSQL